MTRVYRWLTVLHIAFLLYLTYLANSGKGMALFIMVDKFPYGDKIGHLLLMGLLAFLVNMSFDAAQFKTLNILKGSFYVWLAVTLEEIVQLYFPRRSFSLRDLAADYIGIIIFGQLAAWLVMRRLKKESSASSEMSTTVPRAEEPTPR